MKLAFWSSWLCLLQFTGIAFVAEADPSAGVKRYEDRFFAFNYPPKTKLTHRGEAALSLFNADGSFGVEIRNLGGGPIQDNLVLQVAARTYAAEMLQSLLVLEEKGEVGDLHGRKVAVYTSTYRKGHQVKKLKITAVAIESAICYLVVVAPDRTWDRAFADYAIIRESIRLKAIPPVVFTLPETLTTQETDPAQPVQAGGNACWLCTLASTQPGPQATDNALVGVWFKETADLSTFQRLRITLRPDGTYTKESLMRVSVYGTGYIPGRHDGTWRSSGSVVYLSGDGNYPASSHDLSVFNRLR